MAFFERVRAAYLQRAEKEPNRFHIIDASQPMAKVHEAIKDVIDNLMERNDTNCSAQTSFSMLQQSWQQLWQSKQQQQLSHALLFMGASGLGKKHFAQFSQKPVVLQSRTKWGYLWSVRGCHLTQANSHPDLMIIEPQSTGRQSV